MIHISVSCYTGVCIMEISNSIILLYLFQLAFCCKESFSFPFPIIKFFFWLLKGEVVLKTASCFYRDLCCYEFLREGRTLLSP